MKKLSALILLFLCSLWTFGHKDDSLSNNHIARSYISINPLNILLFQQLGLTYEYLPGKFGFGITGGYIYANKASYSNYFIAGPTNYASLGYYTGTFIVPQLNFYFKRKVVDRNATMFYCALKGVYKYMTLDSTEYIVWHSSGNGSPYYTKMVDRVNIYGAFIDIGIKIVRHHFFIDFNFGPGFLCINHDMYISGEKTENYKPRAIDPPRHEVLFERNFTINFTMNIGIAF